MEAGLTKVIPDDETGLRPSLLFLLQQEPGALSNEEGPEADHRTYADWLQLILKEPCLPGMGSSEAARAIYPNESAVSMICGRFPDCLQRRQLPLSSSGWSRAQAPKMGRFQFLAKTRGQHMVTQPGLGFWWANYLKTSEHNPEFLPRLTISWAA